jgi:hypothetical protein
MGARQVSVAEAHRMIGIDAEKDGVPVLIG